MNPKVTIQRTKAGRYSLRVYNSRGGYTNEFFDTFLQAVAFLRTVMGEE